MEILLAIVVVLAFITVLGHAIWVVLAALVRALRPAGDLADRLIRAEMCPRCGALWGERPGTRTCTLCDWPGPVGGLRSARDPGRVVTPLLRRVERFHQLGLISTEVRDRLSQALRAETEPLPKPPRPEAAPEVVFLEPSPPAVERPWVPAGVEPRVTVVRPEEIAPRPEITPEPVLAPAAPRQRLLDLLAAFLEEKNIRWGEIVGGLLIVGCSLALVMSFWSSIAERPLLKFGLFTGVTALLFALGLHAERRWRLPTTALGLLVIATLLIPLNFLAVASIGRGAAAEAIWVWPENSSR